VRGNFDQYNTTKYVPSALPFAGGACYMIHRKIRRLARGGAAR
jgi:hypothetical protein